MKKLQFVILAALALALPGPGGAASIQVTISATAFTPKTLTVNYGDTVKWKNADKVNHQLVADNGAFASPILRPGDWYTFTFKNAGKFGYHDALKPSLKGTITVKGPPAVGDAERRPADHHLRPADEPVGHRRRTVSRTSPWSSRRSRTARPCSRSRR